MVLYSFSEQRDRISAMVLALRNGEPSVNHLADERITQSDAPVALA